jgi:hypothetical protein
MSAESLNLAEIDERLAVVRDNLRELVEQAAAYSGAGDDERMSARIAEQQEKLDELTRRRDALLAPGANPPSG